MIQCSAGSFNLIEFGDPHLTEKQILDHHIVEFDADSYAGNSIVFALNGLCDELSKKFDIPLEEVFRDTFILTCSVIHYFFMHVIGITDLYFLEGSHPHPSLRIERFLGQLIYTLEGNNIKLDFQSCFRESLQISGKFSSRPDNELYNSLLSNKDSISNYYVTIQEAMDRYPHLVRSKIPS